MSQKTPVSSPGKYVLPSAVGFSDSRGELTLVTPDAPLPVIVANATTAGTAPARPLTGQATSSTVAGPFVPTRDAPIHLQLSGEWKGSVAVERSIDGGETRQGLTAGGIRWAHFTGNANEPVWQESGKDVSFWLNIKLESGQLTYRVSQ